MFAVCLLCYLPQIWLFPLPLPLLLPQLRSLCFLASHMSMHIAMHMPVRTVNTDIYAHVYIHVCTYFLPFGVYQFALFVLSVAPTRFLFTLLLRTVGSLLSRFLHRTPCVAPRRAAPQDGNERPTCSTGICGHGPFCCNACKSCDNVKPDTKEGKVPLPAPDGG